MEKNKDVNLQTDFSIKNFIYTAKNEQDNEIKIEGEYLPSDMENLDENVKKAISKAQKTQQDTHISYEKANENRLFYFAPLIADESCAKCHVHDDKKALDKFKGKNAARNACSYLQKKDFNCLALR